MNNLTCMLQNRDADNPQAGAELLPLVYTELRRVAAAKMARESSQHTLQPTALVHEAWLKLVGGGGQQFENRSHFFAVAAEAMRRILIDRARKRKTQRHGGHCVHVQLEDTGLAGPAADDQVLALDEALERLSQEYPIQARVVKLRYFGGMSNEEIAQALGISVTTVKVYWGFARAWLFAAIRKTL